MKESERLEGFIVQSKSSDSGGRSECWLLRMSSDTGEICLGELNVKSLLQRHTEKKTPADQPKKELMYSV